MDLQISHFNYMYLVSLNTNNNQNNNFSTDLYNNIHLYTNTNNGVTAATLKFIEYSNK